MQSLDCSEVFRRPTKFYQRAPKDSGMVSDKLGSLDSQSRGPVFKPLGGSKVHSASHTSEVNKMSTRNFWEVVVKSKLPPQSSR